MAFFHSPNIVTDGLVLCLDAADKTSYSGSIHGGTIATWTDLSGNGNNGTFNNTTFDSGSGGNINFDGTDDYVQIGDSSTMALGTGNVTFMAWVKFNSVSGNQVIIGDEGGSGDTSQNNFHLFMLFDESSVGQIALRGHTLSPNQYNFILSSTNNVVSAGNWYHLVGVLDRSSTSTSKIYVNGVDKTGSATNFDSGANSMDFSYWSLGRRTNVGDFDLNAKIASVIQYNTVLSHTEVLQNFNAQRVRFGV